ncbi:hypothetical protein Bca52824_072659 [Brassica carinata]|uniref:Uncharacterized protein n=1 Tax=Brassica carinata TaxID=52824 RepID=A0A8X7Q8I1_BRACI|nr:hypothetical protein Bca52824_072659 [Brassica carinata]
MRLGGEGRFYEATNCSLYIGREKMDVWFSCNTGVVQWGWPWNSEKLAAIETWDDGKTYEQAKTAEIPMLARFFRYYAVTNHRGKQS